MIVFVINSGSSSIKYQLIKMPEEQPICSGLIERIGAENATITHKVYKAGKEEKFVEILHIKDHADGLRAVVNLLANDKIGVIKDPAEIKVIGHRVVHGGEFFANTSIVTDKVKDEIKKLFALAPLHNPANYLGIEVAEEIFPAAKQIVVFDTAFHQTMPEEAFRYAIPNKYYYDNAIRVYGFHGTSHKYVSEKATDYLQKKDAKLIILHLGNGCSMSAVNAGKCIDTSMGFGPLSGLIMGTRSGDIDPSVVFYMVNEMGLSPNEVSDILNKQSGMLGLTGLSDMRDINKAVEDNNKDAILATKMYAYRAKKFIGSYIAALNGVDAIVFTAGVGENDTTTRAHICENMDALGIVLDPEKNNRRSSELREINTTTGKVKILVVPTNEEVEIARQCFALAD